MCVRKTEREREKEGGEKKKRQRHNERYREGKKKETEKDREALYRFERDRFVLYNNNSFLIGIWFHVNILLV